MCHNVKRTLCAVYFNRMGNRISVFRRPRGRDQLMKAFITQEVRHVQGFTQRRNAFAQQGGSIGAAVAQHPVAVKAEKRAVRLRMARCVYGFTGAVVQRQGQTRVGAGVGAHAATPASSKRASSNSNAATAPRHAAVWLEGLAR